MFESDLTYSQYDKYPVFPGHILIIPKRYVNNFFDLTPDERLSMFDLLDRTKQHLDKEYTPNGFNVGINVNEAAGQTVMHAHMHLIPRYEGDIEDPRGGVRGVIPEKQKY